MFRRRAVIVPRAVIRRPRLLGAAVLGGLGFAAGRASRRPPEPGSGTFADTPDIAEKLKALAEMHASGALTDDEFAAAKGRLLGSSTR